MTDRKERVSDEELAEIVRSGKGLGNSILAAKLTADLVDSRERVRELEKGIRESEVIAGRPCAFCVGSVAYTKPGGGFEFHHDDGCLYAEIRRRKENA